MVLRIDIGNTTHFVSIDKSVTVDERYYFGTGCFVCIYKGCEQGAMIYVKQEQDQSLYYKTVPFVKKVITDKIEQMIRDNELFGNLTATDFGGKEYLNNSYFTDDTWQ